MEAVPLIKSHWLVCLLTFPFTSRSKELIDLLVGTAAQKGERDEMQDEHLSIPDFGDKVAAGAYSGEAYALFPYYFYWLFIITLAHTPTVTLNFGPIGSESVSSAFSMAIMELELLSLQNSG